MTIHIQFEVTPTKGRPEQLVGHAHFLNQGDAPVSFIPVQLKSASLALEIVDREGHPVLLPPPPVPDPSAPTVNLAPNESYLVDYPHFLPSWTQPGEYRLQAQLTGVAGPDPDTASASDWMAVTVTA